MTKKADNSLEFQNFESLAKRVFATPKSSVTKAIAKDKTDREKKRKAG